MTTATQEQALARTAVQEISLGAFHSMDIRELGQILVKSGYFQDAKEASQAMVKVLAGQELGFPPIVSMMNLYIVKGKISLAANLVATQIRRSGRYDYRVKSITNEGCTLAFYQGNELLGESTFTVEDAKKAGVLGGDNYQHYPRNMFFARALTNGARWYCPDVFGGPVYTPDELGARVNDLGEPIDVTPAQAPIAEPLSVAEAAAQAAGGNGTATAAPATETSAAPSAEEQEAIRQQERHEAAAEQAPPPTPAGPKIDRQALWTGVLKWAKANGKKQGEALSTLMGRNVPGLAALTDAECVELMGKLKG
ncbi:MAG: hypothetical protein ACE147_00825 [Candidatus Methylomirabilales bacterium]